LSWVKFMRTIAGPGHLPDISASWCTRQIWVKWGFYCWDDFCLIVINIVLISQVLLLWQNQLAKMAEFCQQH
jgi:hypothetical protein